MLLLLISPMFVFGSNSKGFKEFKSGISDYLSVSLKSLLFSFSMFFLSFSVLFHFFLSLKCEFWKKKKFTFVNRIIESYSRPIKAK